MFSANFGDAIDISSELVNQVKPKRQVLPDLSNQANCMKSLHQVRSETLKVFGGATVASIVGYIITKEALERKLVSMKESIRMLNAQKQSGKAAAKHYAERSKLLQGYLNGVVSLKEMTKRIRSYYGVFDPAFEKAFEAQVQILEVNGRFWENEHKRNFSPEQHAQQVRKASDALGNMKSMLEGQRRKSLDIVAHAFSTLPKANYVSSLIAKLPSAFAFLSSSTFLAFQLFTYSSEPASGSMSSQAVRDENLFNDEVPVKDLCSQIISGDPKDFEVARRKIGGLMSVKLAEASSKEMDEYETNSFNAR